MSSRAIMIAFIIGIILVLTQPGWARKKSDNLTKHAFEWSEVTEADWEVPDDSIYEGYDAIMLFERIVANDKKLRDDECYRTVYRRIRVLGEEGRKWADVEVPIFDSDQEIEIIRGRTVLRDGSVVELLDEHIFEKEILRAEDEQVDQASFSLPGVTNDCILEYVFRVKTEDYTPYWIVQKDIPLKEATFHWILAEFKTSAYWADLFKDFATPNYLLLNRYSKMHVKHEPNVPEAKELIFTIDPTPAFEGEPMSFPESWSRTRLAAYYSSNVPSASYWGERATDVNESVTKFCKNERKLDKILQDFPDSLDDDGKIAAAYNWVAANIQDYHDLRAEHDAKASDKDAKKRQRELKIKDNDDLDDIIKHGYGSRMDKSVVFIALLRKLGIQATMAFVVDRTEDIFTERIKHWQFDVPLVAVPGDGKSTFYAPAYTYLPPGQVPWFAEGVNALVTGVEEYMQPVPFSHYSENSILCSYEYSIADDMSLVGQVKSRRNGHPSRSTRLVLRWKDSTDIQKSIADHLKDIYPEATIDSVECKNADTYEAPLQLSWHSSFPPLEEQGNLLLLSPFDYFYRLENDFVKEQRKWPILFKYAYELREAGKIDVPEGWTIKAVPFDTSFENGVGKIATSIQTMGNSILIQRMFTLESPFLRADGYKHVRDLMATRQDLSSAVVVLERSN